MTELHSLKCLVLKFAKFCGEPRAMLDSFLQATPPDQSAFANPDHAKQKEERFFVPSKVKRAHLKMPPAFAHRVHSLVRQQ